MSLTSFPAPPEVPGITVTDTDVDDGATGAREFRITADSRWRMEAYLRVIAVEEDADLLADELDEYDSTGAVTIAWEWE